MFEREPQEVILQGCALPQDTSHQYTRFASPVSDNRRLLLNISVIIRINGYSTNDFDICCQGHYSK